MSSNVLDYLEHSRAAFPGKCAVIDEREQLTCEKLYLKSRRIGTALCGWITQGEPVGVYLDKCADALCVFLGTVHAGGLYSVLNPELPKARLAQIAGVLSPRVIVTSHAELPAAAEIFPDFPIVAVEELTESEPDEARLLTARRRAVDTDPLYVNFTSGSTGTPKGIVVAHRSVLDFIGCFTELFGITGKDVIANQAPFDFDVSVKDIYSALGVGATLLIIPRRLFPAPAALIDFLCDHRATAMIWAASALCRITTFHALDYRVPETVNKVLFSGEVMPAKALADFRRHLPDAMYVNLYGPTEITCNCTYHILRQDRDYSGGIPIGIPFPNEDVFLLDGENCRIPEPENTIDVLFLGNSESYCGFVPMEIWKDQGITSYVCGSSMQVLYQSEQYLRSVFRNQSPKIVFLETLAVFSDYGRTEALPEMAGEWIPLLRYHDRWKTLGAEDFYKPVRYTHVRGDKGYHTFREIEAADTTDYMSPTEEVRRVPSKSISHIRDMQEFCQEHGAQLILVSVPSTANWSQASHNGIAAVADSLGIPYLDLNLMQEEVPIDWAVDTKDRGDHMNITGARKVSDFMGQWLAETGLFEDKRANEAYSQWNQFLQEYLEDKEVDKTDFDK